MDWGDCVVDGVPTLNCIPIVFKNLVNAGLIFAGVIAVILIIISGLQMIFSGGDAKQVEGARKTATYAILGLVLILLSFFIVNAIGVITGAQCINKFGFNTCK